MKETPNPSISKAKENAESTPASPRLFQVVSGCLPDFSVGGCTFTNKIGYQSFVTSHTHRVRCWHRPNFSSPKVKSNLHSLTRAHTRCGIWSMASDHSYCSSYLSYDTMKSYILQRLYIFFRQWHRDCMHRKLLEIPIFLARWSVHCVKTGPTVCQRSYKPPATGVILSGH